MTGTSIIMPDASIAQASVLASLWAPETVAPLLLSEFVLGVDAPTSILNRATPASAGTEIGSVWGATITNAGSGGTPGTYNAIAATGGGGSGATVNVVVGAGGTISSATVAAHGAGYTSVPALPLTSIPGLTGGVITLSLNKPTYNAHSAIIATGASGSGPYGIDTGLVPSQTDQTMAIVMKKPAGSAGSIYTAAPSGSGPWTGFIYAATANKLSFYNSLTGNTPAVPIVDFPDATNFNVFFGWGSVGGVGNVRSCSAGALNAAVAGTTNGGARPTNNLQIGNNTFGNGQAEIAYAARAPSILTDAQMLAWYLALKNGPLGQAITIA